MRMRRERSRERYRKAATAAAVRPVYVVPSISVNFAPMLCSGWQIIVFHRWTPGDRLTQPRPLHTQQEYPR